MEFKGFASIIKTSQLMLYREIIAVCSEIHTKHINTLRGQNVELLNVKLAVHIVTTGLYEQFASHRPHTLTQPALHTAPHFQFSPISPNPARSSRILIPTTGRSKYRPKH
jgi:hypothetical protein